MTGPIWADECTRLLPSFLIMIPEERLNLNSKTPPQSSQTGEYSKANPPSGLFKNIIIHSFIFLASMCYLLCYRHCLTLQYNYK